MARREGPAASKLDSCELDGELLQLEEYDLEEEDTSNRWCVLVVDDVAQKILSSVTDMKQLALFEC